MERGLERCASLDVHKKTVTACVRVPGDHGDRAQHVRTVGTTTAEHAIAGSGTWGTRKRSWPWRMPSS